MNTLGAYPSTFTPARVAAVFGPARQSLRVLFVVAAPVGDAAPPGHEWLALQQQAKLGDIPAALVRLLPPTRDGFERALSACKSHGVSPHVFHFAGPSQPGHLLFEDSLCCEAPFPREDLEHALRESGVRLVVLGAGLPGTYETISLAQYLVERQAVEAAIGYARPVPGEAATLFASQLYKGLGRGEELRRAFSLAESTLERSHPLAAGAIRLLGREVCLDDVDPAVSPARVSDGSSGRGRMAEVPIFFGRAGELVEVGRFFENPGQRALAIAGIGGIGKTALALEASNRHAWRFPGGVALASPRSISPGQPTAESLVHLAATSLLPEAETRLTERLLDHLGQHPALLVFDELEHLPPGELPRLLRFIEQLPLNGSKVLLTLQPVPALLHDWPWLGVLTLTQGLSGRAGAAYVVHVAGGRAPEIGLATPDAEGTFQGLPRLLAVVLAGHPKLIDVAVGIVAAGGLPRPEGTPPESLEAEQAKELAAEAIQTRLEELLASSLRLLDELSRRLLAVLPLFPDGSFTREELTAAAAVLAVEAGNAGSEPPGQWARRAVQAWTEAGIVGHDAAAGVYRLHPIVQAYVEKRGQLDADAAGRVFTRLLLAALQYATAQRESYQALEQRCVHLLGLFELAWESDRASEEQRRAVARAIDAMSGFLIHQRYWPLLERWQARLEELPETTPEERSHRLYRKGLLLAGQGRHEEAVAVLREALRLFEDRGDQQGRAAPLIMLGQVEANQGHLSEGRALVREAVAILEDLGSDELEKARPILQELDRRLSLPVDTGR